MSQGIVVVANRLPVREVNGDWTRSPGGLVSALTPLLQAANGVWVGWSGVPDRSLEPFDHDGIHHVAIQMSSSEVSEHYLGFSNKPIWPRYHHAIRTPEYHRSWWRVHSRINQRLADGVAEAADPGDIIWIHDYHLQLLPMMVKERVRDASIRFFLHIPFPPVELYGRLPWRSEIVEGLLASDVVAFQTQRSARNFTNAAATFGDAKAWGDMLVHPSGKTTVVSTPISIDVEGFTRIADDSSTKNAVDRIRSDLGHPKFLFLGADRLDYTKGIDVRLKAFETLLTKHPQLARDTKFVQIGVPSRQTIGDYAAMRQEIEKVAGHINSTHGSVHHVPVHYAYESLSRDELVGYYRAADVMIVTPLVDGMNLVAKEFVASRTDLDGVLILSEFAGAEGRCQRESL